MISERNAAESSPFYSRIESLVRNVSYLQTVEPFDLGTEVGCIWELYALFGVAHADLNAVEDSGSCFIFGRRFGTKTMVGKGKR